MRRTRWLTLALIVGVVIWVGATYIKSKASYDRNSPTPPPPLEDGVNARSSGWTYVKSNGACPIVKIHADRFREIKHPSVEQIEGVDLKLYNKDCTEYEWVKSAKAQFDETAKTMYSDGQVDIDLHVPVEGPPH